MRQLTNGLELFFFYSRGKSCFEYWTDSRRQKNFQSWQSPINRPADSQFWVLDSELKRKMWRNRPQIVNPRLTTSNIVGSCCIRLYVAKSLTGFKLCATTCNRVSKRTQQRQRRHSKSQFAASNFITLIPSRSIRQMLAIFSAVEF